MKLFSVSLPKISMLAALLLASAAMAWAQEQEAADKALVSVTVNGNVFGDSEIRIAADGSFLLPSRLVRKALEGIAKPEITMGFPDSDNYITVRELSIFGIAVLFDASSLVLSIEVPASDMTPVDLLAGSGGQIASGSSLRQESFSAILDLSLSLGRGWDGSAEAEEKKPYASLDLRPALNLLGFVAEGLVETGWTDGYYAKLASARIVKDFPKSQTRLFAGFVDTWARTFQSAVPLYGAVFYHESSLGGERNPAKETLEEFVIDNAADIAIALNGVTVKRVRLQPGTYRLADFPMASGFNEVVIEIAEAGKAKREIRLMLTSDGALLAKGGIDWYAGIGVDRETQGQPFATAYASYGVFRTLTMGMDFQAGFGTMLGGASATWASPIGSLSAGAALAWAYDEAQAVQALRSAMRINWRFSVPGLPYMPQFALGAEFREAQFSSPQLHVATETPDKTDTLLLLLQLNQRLPGNGTFAAAASSKFDAGAWNRKAISLGYHQALSGSASLSASVGIDYRTGFAAEPSASISLTVTPPDRKVAQFRKDMLAGRDSFDLSIPLGSSMGSGFSARGEGLLGSAIYGEPSPRTASLALNGPLGFLNLSAGAAYQYEPSISLEELTVNGGASTSIAFAGGRFGMARTIADSFAFLVPDKTVRRERVDAKSAGSSTMATSIAGHAALIPNLESYSASLVGIEMPESAPETSPSIPAVVLRPGYRSGTIIAVSARRSFLVRGRLLGPDGMPSASMIGDVSTASGKALGIATFTDDDGLFEVYGLTPGAYSIRWENGNSTDFSLGETELREVTIGDLLSEYPALSGSNALIGPSGERTKP